MRGRGGGGGGRRWLGDNSRRERAFIFIMTIMICLLNKRHHNNTTGIFSTIRNSLRNTEVLISRVTTHSKTLLFEQPAQLTLSTMLTTKVGTFLIRVSDTNKMKIWNLGLSLRY